MPKLSVVMSIYQEPVDWIRLAINSILNQSYKDFEFIIVNDNPDRADNALLLKEFIENDQRVVVIENEYNLGLTKSLNKALEKAVGQYIVRMDADDISLPSRFEKQVAFLDCHPDILCVGSWTSIVDDTGQQTNVYGKYEANPRWVKAQFLQNSQVCHPTAMFHRIVNGSLVRYDESVRYAQDYSLWVSILPYGGIANIREKLFYYRLSDKQITSIKKEEQQNCARKTQSKAFALFNFDMSESFLSLFYAITIRHNYDFPIIEAKREFVTFFKSNKKTMGNASALAVIYGTYFSFIRRNTTSLFDALFCAIKNSSLIMMLFGIIWMIHLLSRKISLLVRFE